jgi:hypothetical protein
VGTTRACAPVALAFSTCIMKQIEQRGAFPYSPYQMSKAVRIGIRNQDCKTELRGCPARTRSGGSRLPPTEERGFGSIRWLIRLRFRQGGGGLDKGMGVSLS